MPFIITQAKRELIWTKVALMGPSGSGKTYSALRMATGMLDELKKLGQEKNGKILLANTEASRGRYYANEFNYDIVDLGSPFQPEMFVDLINYAVQQNYPILILDSTSPEWDGKGGCLEIHASYGGRYQDWAKISPRHDKFLATIADSPIHIVATMRGKDQYEMEKDDNGKSTVRKLGVGARQRDGFEYEFTCTFTIDQQSNTITTQKDNTHIFEHEGAVKIAEIHGQKLIQWANSGEGYTIPVREVKVESDDPKVLRKEVIDLGTKLGGTANEDFMTLLRSYEPNANPNKITDVEKLKEFKKKLLEMVEKAKEN